MVDSERADGRDRANRVEIEEYENVPACEVLRGIDLGGLLRFIDGPPMTRAVRDFRAVLAGASCGRANDELRFSSTSSKRRLSLERTTLELRKGGSNQHFIRRAAESVSGERKLRALR